MIRIGANPSSEIEQGLSKTRVCSEYPDNSAHFFEPIATGANASQLQQAIVELGGRIETDAATCVSSTMLRERSVLRLYSINPLTTEDDIAQTIDRLAAARP